MSLCVCVCVCVTVVVLEYFFFLGGLFLTLHSQQKSNNNVKFLYIFIPLEKLIQFLPFLTFFLTFLTQKNWMISSLYNDDDNAFFSVLR